VPTVHSSLTGAQLHEPKGVASASVGTVYVANGAGSGAWIKVPLASLDTSTIKGTNKFSLLATIADISTAETVLVPLPNACTLNKATLILAGAITTADATITFTNSTGPTTIGTLTVVQSGSAEGSMFTFTPVSSNAFTAGTFLKFATNGASDTAAKATVLLEFTLT
jgi:hypothetical protein